MERIDERISAHIRGTDVPVEEPSTATRTEPAEGNSLKTGFKFLY